MQFMAARDAPYIQPHRKRRNQGGFKLGPRMRLVAAVAAALVVAALAVWLLQDHSADGAAGDHRVLIVVPQGTWLDGTVHLAKADADALGALTTFAANNEVRLDVIDYGGACGKYVAAIGPYRASGASGWTYQVETPDGWDHPLRSADCTPLGPDQAVRWRWVE
jgi:hypothetical protein